MRHAARKGKGNGWLRTGGKPAHILVRIHHQPQSERRASTQASWAENRHLFAQFWVVSAGSCSTSPIQRVGKAQFYSTFVKNQQRLVIGGVEVITDRAHLAAQ